MGRPKKFESKKKSEKEKTAERLGDFDPNDSPRVKEFFKQFHKLDKDFMLAMLMQIEKDKQIILTRDDKRSKQCLLKVIDNNWAVIQPRLVEFTVQDQNGVPMYQRKK